MSDETKVAEDETGKHEVLWPGLPKKYDFSLAQACGLLTYCEGVAPGNTDNALACECGACMGCATRALFETLWGNQGKQAIVLARGMPEPSIVCSTVD